MENRWAALSLGHVSMANIPCMEFMPGSLAPLRGQRLRMWGEQQGRGQTLESEGRHWSHARGWEHGPCGASQWGSSRSSEPQLGCRVDPHSLEGRGQREKGRSICSLTKGPGTTGGCFRVAEMDALCLDKYLVL